MADPAPQTPLWWLNKLEGQLIAREPVMRLMAAYYTGDHPLPFLTPAHSDKMRSQFRQLLEDSRSNFMALVIDAVEERLRVDGFRLSAATDELADKRSWELWQANNMDQESQTALLEALIKGVSYLSVWAGDKYPTIAVEDACQTIVGYAPGTNFRERAAALKVWVDDWTGKRRANVYLPDGIYKYVSATAAKDEIAYLSPTAPPVPGWAQAAVASATALRPQWIEFEDDPFSANPLNVVPIVPLRNQPLLSSEGMSEIVGVYRVQNQINGFLFLLALAGYFGAHRQRWAIGLKIMVDEATGQELDPFDVAIDRLWQSENPDTKFGEFEQTDLTQYLKAIEQKVMHIAVTTRTPRHYLFQEGQSPSGDAIKSAESGLVQKVQRKQRPFGEGLEEAIGLARRFAGETDAPVDSEIVWADPSTESDAVITDAVIKQFAAGLIPWEAALERLGYSQTQIARYQAMRLQDQLVGSMFNPPPTPPTEPIQTQPPPITA